MALTFRSTAPKRKRVPVPVPLKAWNAGSKTWRIVSSFRQASGVRFVEPVNQGDFHKAIDLWNHHTDETFEIEEKAVE